MNENAKPAVRPAPNPITQAMHRRQVLWQIWVPFGVVAVLVLISAVGIVLTSFQGNDLTIGRLKDISLIWLILPMLLLTIIFIVATAGIAFLLFRALRVLPSYTRQAQDLFVVVSFYTRKFSDALVEPFLKAHSFSASIRALRRK